MSYIVDIIIVALFVILVAHAYKKGFLSTIIDTFSVAISAVVSHYLFKDIAEKAYNTFVRDLVETRFTRVLDEISSSLSVAEKVNAMIGGLPQGAVKLAQAIGVNFTLLSNSVNSSFNLSNDELVKVAVDKIGHPIMINVTEVVTFIALFVVIAVALKFIAGFFKKANDIPFLGKLNAGLGGVIGLVRAFIVIYIVCTAFYFVVGMSGSAQVIDAVNSSIIYGFIINNNPIISIIG